MSDLDRRSPEVPAGPPPHVTVAQGMSGWFAVLVSWNDEGFWEPEQTGVGRYDERFDAEVEAMEWADDEGLAFHGPNYASGPREVHISEASEVA